MSRRALLRNAVGVGAVAAAAQGAALSPADAAATPYLPYGRDSYFRTPVAGMSVNHARTASFREFMRRHPDQREYSYPRITGMDGNEWGTTTHVSSADEPVWTVRNPHEDARVLRRQGFHMADRVARRVPTGDQDRPFLIVDREFGYSLFCADVVPDVSSRTITVSSSAVFHHSSNGLDGRNRRSDDRRNFASRGRIPDAMAIRPDLLKAGIANDTGLGHVLHAFFVETRTRAGFCHPMVGNESGKRGWGAEGDRIAIKRSVDLRARGLRGAALVVARTLQTHGFYIGDNSGSATMLKGVQTTRTYNPYAGTNMSADCLRKLTWNDFVVLERP